MRKTHIFLVILLLASVLIQNPVAQPQYYNANSGGIGNTLPFGSLAVTGYKTQWLIGPGEYSLPSPAPSGFIMKLYIWISSSGTGTYTNFTMKMGQTAITSFPAGTYGGQLDTVLYRASMPLTATINSWLVFRLDRPFSYNPAQSIVIEISHCGFTGSGFNIWQSAGTTGIMRRNNHSGTPTCVFTYGSQDSRILQNGIELAPLTPPYYNYNTTGGDNSFPLNQASGKMCQWLVGPSEYNQPSPALGGGYIKGFYFRISGTYPLGPLTYNILYLRLGQTALTSLPTGTFYTGTLDTVYVRTNVTLQAAINTWLFFPLRDSIPYNPAQSLVIELGQCGASGTVSGFSLTHTNLTGNRRSWSVGGCPFVYSGQGNNVVNSGVYIKYPLGINKNNEVPDAYRLDQNYPNPFNPVTTIKYGISRAGNVKLAVYDVLGRQVAVIVNEFRQGGSHSVNFNASELASGVYVYTIRSGEFTDTKKMVLIK